jgi:hypothetical protein
MQNSDIQVAEQLHKQKYDAKKWADAPFSEKLEAFKKAQQARVEAGHIATPRATLKQDAQGLNKLARLAELLRQTSQ